MVTALSIPLIYIFFWFLNKRLNFRMRYFNPGLNCQIPSCRSIKYKSSNSDVTNSTHIKKEKKRKEKDLSPQIIEDKQIMTYLTLLPYLLRIFLSGPLVQSLTTLDQIFSTSHLHFYDPTITKI